MYTSSPKQDNGLSFSSSPASFFAGTSVDSAASISSSSSDWDSSSAFSRYDGQSGQSSSVSPASSIASSPALRPDRRLSPVFDELSLGGAAKSGLLPSGTDVAAYASQIIRNEAYALLALASRIAPANNPATTPQPLAVDPFQAMTESQAAVGIDAALHSLGSSIRQESRSNIAFRAIVDQLSSLPPHGKIVVTGVGKSGIAGRKLVATFCSLGIQSVFLHPLEALHGDLGVICPCSPSTACDALLMISHSGATAELMRLLPIVRPRVRALVAVTRDPDSVLARSCTHWLDAGTGAHVGPTKNGGHNYTDEADSALPAPTSSVVSVLAAGDALALTLSRLRLGWDSDGKARRMDFLRCHPGGQLGIELGREGRGIEPSGAAMAAAAATTSPSPATSSLNTTLAPVNVASATVA